MRTRILGLMGAGLCFGCAGEPPPATEGFVATEEVSLSEASPVPTVVAEGEGVTLRWPTSVSVQAQSDGLGAVVSTRPETAGGLSLMHEGGVEERWTVRPTGAEQSWRFGARPAGDRVAVTVTLAGVQLDRSADDGIWLRAATGESLRYSHATWIDAQGRRTAVPSRWVDGRIVLEVPAAVVGASVYPAVLDPVLTPVFVPESVAVRTDAEVLRGEMVRTPTGGLLFTPLAPLLTSTADSMLMVQRVDAAGVPVPGTFRGVIGSNLFSNIYRAAPSGVGAWVVWQEGGIRGVRVDGQGAPIDQNPVVLQTTGTLVDLACLPTRCLILSKVGDQLVFSRFAQDGTVLDPTPVVLGTPTRASLDNSGLSDHPLTTLNDRFVAAWSQVPSGSTAEVMLARIGLDGVVQDPGGRPVTTAGAVRIRPLLGSNGSTLFLGFQASASGPRPAGRYNVLLDRDLAPVSAVTVLGTTELTTDPKALWDGTRWVLATPTHVVRFNPDGTRLDPAPRAIPLAAALGGRYAETVLEADSGGFYILRRDSNPSTFRDGVGFSSMLQRVASDGALATPPRPIQVGYDDAWQPRVGGDGTEFVVSWMVGARTPRLARIAASGTVRDTPAVPLTLTGQSLYTMSGVVLEGSVARVFGNIGAPDNPLFGQVGVDFVGRTTTTPTFVGGANGAGQIVRANTQRLLLFQPTSTFRTSAIWRLDTAGRPIDMAGIALPTTIILRGAFDGTRTLLVYSPTGSEMFARRIDATGDFTDVTPRSLAALGAINRNPMQVAYGSGGHLLVWVDTSSRLRAMRLGLDGAPRDPTPLTVGTGSFWGSLEVSFNGQNFVVVWSEGGSLQTRSVYAARVSPAGALLDPTPLLVGSVAMRASAGADFSAASDTRGSTLVAYNVFDRNLGATVVRARFLREDGMVVQDSGVDVPIPRDTGIDAGIDVPRDTGIDTGIDVQAPRDNGIDTGTDVQIPRDTGMDVPVPSDTGVDVPTSNDTGVDAPIASDAGGDVPVATDTPVVVDTPAVDVLERDVPTAPGTRHDAGQEAGIALPDGGPTPADAGPPVDGDNGGFCSVRGGAGAGSSQGGWATGALVIAGAVLRRRRIGAERDHRTPR